MAWLINAFPNTRVTLENAAIGATGSDLAVFRAQRDILDHTCDLVFVEYAVNDDPVTETTLRSREGLLRQLLAGAGRDIILIYTFSQPMYAAMIADELPTSIAQFEALAAHYQIPSVWVGLHALQQVQHGIMRWEEWLPDGLHPRERGSLSYGEAIITYLREELGDFPSSSPMLTGDARPVPLTPQHWERATIVPWANIVTHGPWLLRRWQPSAFVGQMLTTAAIGATLNFTFTGNGLLLASLFGSTAAEFRWRIDTDAWQTTVRERPTWAGEYGWLRCDVLTDALPVGQHSCTIEVVHGDCPDCRGTNCYLVFIGVLT